MQRIGLPENLKASCKLFLAGDVSGTTAYDISGSGNNGTLVNSPTTQRIQGYKGFVFNGSNTAISTSYALNMNADWSISVTCIPMVVNTTTNTFISRQGNSSPSGGANDTYFILLHRSDNAAIAFQWGNGSGSGGTQQSFSDTNTIGTPYRITITHSGTTCKGYRNGVLDWTLNIGTNFTSETNRTIQIGSWLDYTGARNVYGNNKTINPVVYNKELSATEVYQDFLSFYI